VSIETLYRPVTEAPSLLDGITVLILTYNEAANIGRTLEKLDWAPRILVIDSFSTDETCDIVRKYARAEVIQRNFDTHSNQWNFGLGQVRTEWALSLDADYQITNEFVHEVRGLHPKEEVDAYYAPFKYCVAGRCLRGSLYPPRALLFRTSRCHFEQDGHTQLLRFRGASKLLHSVIYHDDRKSLTHWLRAQDRYAFLEAEHLLTNSSDDLNFADRLRRMIVPAPFAVFVYLLLGKGMILDGWQGWYYVLQRTLAEILLSLRLIEQKLLD
jgi:glycosyltransferase involved in cell wall biosynthesis